MRPESDSVELRAAVARLEGDPFFMASVLADYRTALRLNDQHIAKALGCNVEALTSLAFCRTPSFKTMKSFFLSDVQAIANYVGLRLGRARENDTHSAIGLDTKTVHRGGRRSVLKAARDKQGDGDNPDKPKSRKR